CSPWAPCATRCNPAIRGFYDRLLAAGKAQKVALVACMHKLLTIPSAMLKHQTPWQGWASHVTVALLLCPGRNLRGEASGRRRSHDQGQGGSPYGSVRRRVLQPLSGVVRQRPLLRAVQRLARGPAGRDQTQVAAPLGQDSQGRRPGAASLP